MPPPLLLRRVGAGPLTGCSLLQVEGAASHGGGAGPGHEAGRLRAGPRPSQAQAAVIRQRATQVPHGGRNQGGNCHAQLYAAED